MSDVTAVEIDFGEKTATVTTKGTRQLTRAEVENVLKAKGYGVTGFAEKTSGPVGQ